MKKYKIINLLLIIAVLIVLCFLLFIIQKNQIIEHIYNKDIPLWRTRNQWSVKTRCDMIISPNEDKIDLNINKKYITIFVKSDKKNLKKFILLYPLIKTPFILITGSTDSTIPYQIDYRYKKYSQDFVKELKVLANTPNLINWYAENLETQFNKKLIPIPLGFIRTDEILWQNRNYWKNLKLYQPRPPKIMTTYRVRTGIQWDDRRYVMNVFKNDNMFITEPVDDSNWLKTLSKCSHVICVHGGGLDPCPRIFEALWMGCIPIAIGTDTARICFKDFPIYWIDKWEDLPKIIKTDNFWVEQKIYYYQLNNLSEEKFTMDYWWKKIQKNCL